MTNTVTAAPAAAGRKTSARQTGREVLAGFLSTATADTEMGLRVRALCDELEDIARDRELASRYVEPGTWLRELADEERDVWEHIVEALTPVSSANTKEE
ncbi:hypothetical protein [Prauserella muralis]|uniref:Uncharacterized protein n=1 Tax=Prauserella muralis TaxID=588067 RepID=A0A2V4ADA1_9PSEU|nr:hypothetical protein [Prauserella muralis]PXY16564.1 hypothetical protein BAY60_35800 [Prauserella muralis]TWE11196.1 hypothetical protein FHX69_7415 [Prauserella muralis]